MRAVEQMKDAGAVCYDATHSMQRSGGPDGTGGARQFTLPVMRAALAVGVAALFFECHDEPSQALSDRDTQWPLADLTELLFQAFTIDGAVK